MNSLDIYSKVEDLIGIIEARPKLYSYYEATLATLKFKSLLDVGCGDGDFLVQIASEFPNSSFMGIDLSEDMISKALSKNLNAKVCDIATITQQFDVVTAVFDMINYLSPKELPTFMGSIERVLNPNGYFLCDINTLYAFRDVATGSFVKDAIQRFVTVDSDFEDEVFTSEFTLFEQDKEDKAIYHKSQGTIYQYFHSVEKFQKSTNLKLIKKTPLKLYTNKHEKQYLVFQKI